MKLKITNENNNSKCADFDLHENLKQKRIGCIHFSNYGGYVYVIRADEANAKKFLIALNRAKLKNLF